MGLVHVLAQLRLWVGSRNVISNITSFSLLNAVIVHTMWSVTLQVCRCRTQLNSCFQTGLYEREVNIKDLRVSITQWPQSCSVS